MIKDNELLEKYNDIWEKLSSSIANGLDSKPAHNEIYLKTKIKSYEVKTNASSMIIKWQNNVVNVFVYR